MQSQPCRPRRCQLSYGRHPVTLRNRRGAARTLTGRRRRTSACVSVVALALAFGVPAAALTPATAVGKDDG